MSWSKGKGTWGSKGGSGAWPSSWSPKGGNGKAAAEKKDWVRKVQWNDRLPKYYLRPYVDQAGSPFVTGNLEEKDLLSTRDLAAVMAETCSEYCSRQGVALSEGAANLQVGAELLQHHFGTGSEDGSMTAEKAMEGLQKVGIEGLLQQLASADGKKFQEACQYLNMSNPLAERSEKATAQAVKRYLRFLTKDSGAKEAAFRRLARFSARLYLMAMEGLEAMAAMNQPQTMAEGINKVAAGYNLPEDCKAWVKKPADQNLLVWSLVAAYHQQKLEGGSKKRGGHFDWDAEEANEDVGAKGSKGAGRGQWSDEEEDDARAPVRRGGGKGPAAKRPKLEASKDALASDEEVEADLDLKSSEEEGEASKVDVTSWPMDDVENFKTLLQELEDKIDTKERPAIQRLQEEVHKIPGALLKVEGLEKIIAGFQEKSRYPNKAALKTLVAKLKGVALKAEAEWKKSAQ